MSQHDYVIDNAGGAAVRADINNALQAIKTMNSGATAPTVTAPYMFWFDTSAVQLKQRNAADTAWTVVPIPSTVGAALVAAASAAAARATLGLGAVAFAAYSDNTTQTIATGAYTKLKFQTEEYDTASAFDNATNFRFQPTTAGYYTLNAGSTFQAGAGVISDWYLALYKNGAVDKLGSMMRASSTGQIVRSNVSSVIYLNGSTDYVEVFAFQNSGSSYSFNVGSTGQSSSYFNGILVAQ